MKTQAAKRAFNARFSDEVHLMIEDLAAQWDCSLTQAVAKAVRMAHAGEGAPPGQQCTYTTPSPLPCAARTKVKTHQRRLSAFISSEHCRFSTSRPIHVLKPSEQS